MTDEEKARLKQIELQNEKLALEIRAMGESPVAAPVENGMARFARILTQIAPAITIISLVVGVIQYTAEQRSQRRSRNETTIRTSYAHLMSFPRKASVSVVETTLDFQVLAHLLDDERRESMNGVLADMILRDLDFKKARDVDFTENIHTHWPWFPPFVRNRSQFNIELAEKCLDGLLYFGSRNKSQLGGMSFDRKSGMMRGRRTVGLPRWSTYRHLGLLLLVFARSMDRLDPAADAYKDLIDEFRALPGYERIVGDVLKKTDKGYVFCNLKQCGK